MSKLAALFALSMAQRREWIQPGGFAPGEVAAGRQEGHSHLFRKLILILIDLIFSLIDIVIVFEGY